MLMLPPCQHCSYGRRRYRKLPLSQAQHHTDYLKQELLGSNQDLRQGGLHLNYLPCFLTILELVVPSPLEC